MNKLIAVAWAAIGIAVLSSCGAPRKSLLTQGLEKSGDAQQCASAIQDLTAVIDQGAKGWESVKNSDRGETGRILAAFDLGRAHMGRGHSYFFQLCQNKNLELKDLQAADRYLEECCAPTATINMEPSNPYYSGFVSTYARVKSNCCQAQSETRLWLKQISP